MLVDSFSMACVLEEAQRIECQGSDWIRFLSDHSLNSLPGLQLFPIVRQRTVYTTHPAPVHTKENEPEMGSCL